MSKLLPNIKSRVFIASNKKAINVLEGEYVSAAQGRSMDFDDLREYSQGDSVKDIDWKASARHNTPLVKQYIASRKQPVLFVIDTGLNAKAVTMSGELKKTVALTAAGVLGVIAMKHSDPVGAVFGDIRGTIYQPAKESETHLERLLQNINFAMDNTLAASNVYKQLEYVRKHVRHQCLIVVISDTPVLSDEVQSVLKWLQKKHDVLWIAVQDGNPFDDVKTAQPLSDISEEISIPAYLRTNKKLQEYLRQEETKRLSSIDSALTNLRISHTYVSSTQSLIPDLLKLLHRRLREPRS